MHLYHPSGRPSFFAVRELVQLMPCAVILEDADTFEVLAFSQRAAELFQIDPDGYFRTADFCDENGVNQRIRALVEASPDHLNSEIMQIRDLRGRAFRASVHTRLLPMADRRIMLSTVEPLLADECPEAGACAKARLRHHARHLELVAGA